MPALPRWLAPALLVCAIIAIVAGIRREGARQAQLAAATQDWHAASARAKAAEAFNSVVLAHDSAVLGQSLRLAARADSVSRHADSVAARVKASSSIFATLAAAAPDTCAAVIAAGQQALAESDSAYLAERRRGDLEHARGDSLQGALTETAEAIRKSGDAMETLMAAGDSVLRAVRPSRLDRVLAVLPKPIGGVFVDVSDISPRIRYGIGLGYKF